MRGLVERLAHHWALARKILRLAPRFAVPTQTRQDDDPADVDSPPPEEDLCGISTGPANCPAAGAIAQAGIPSAIAPGHRLCGFSKKILFNILIHNRLCQNKARIGAKKRGLARLC
jgi:hypothetical protein